ncbi:hypothetical protein EDD85DRAFT_464567 [Armillaria nabsnona]|nr:hypothetical protein EDD85DRAFT_464567 [Armillaria nabsnona]
MLMYIQYPASHFRGLLTCLLLSLIQSLSLSSMYMASGNFGFSEMTQGGNATRSARPDAAPSNRLSRLNNGGEKAKANACATLWVSHQCLFWQHWQRNFVHKSSLRGQILHVVTVLSSVSILEGL